VSGDGKMKIRPEGTTEMREDSQDVDVSSVLSGRKNILMTATSHFVAG
jgi:hypothetical protein